MTALDGFYSAVTDATGTCLIDITTGARVRDWVVSQVSVEMSGSPGAPTTRCVLRKNGLLICPVKPDIDTAGGDPPVTLNASDHLTITWTGATPGTVGKISILYDDGRVQ